MLKKKMIHIDLFDEYQSLLTEKQRQIFSQHFFEDLSFTEIAENSGITKQAVSDSLKKSCEQLEYFESKLQLNAKHARRSALLKRLPEFSSLDDFLRIVAELQELS